MKRFFKYLSSLHSSQVLDNLIKLYGFSKLLNEEKKGKHPLKVAKKHVGARSGETEISSHLIKEPITTRRQHIIPQR